VNKEIMQTGRPFTVGFSDDRIIGIYAEVAELVDALVSKTSGGDPVPVQIRPSAPTLTCGFI
jgi:hypothetical protein